MAEKVLLEMMSYFGQDVLRINHALKVYSFATTIAKNENLDSEILEIIELSSILHDIGIKNAEEKYHSSNGKYQEIEGPAVAKEILSRLGVSTKIIERVSYLIANHHTYSKIEGDDFQILVEADFLVNIFEDKMSKKSIESVYNKYFKTKTGRNIIQQMYL